MRQNQEQAFIASITQNSEATMNSVVTNSVAMTILGLKLRYLGKHPSQELVDAAYEECQTFLRSLTIPNIPASELSACVEHMLSKVWENTSRLDYVTVYVFDDQDHYQEETIEFSLKVVLTLLVSAYLDDAQFAHAYTGTLEERIKKAHADRPMRLLSMFKCFKEISLGKCHHGIRNDLILLLNGTYEGIHIIEDAASSVFYWVKEKINEQFDVYYPMHRSERSLLSAILSWMREDNPSALLTLMDSSGAVSIENQIYAYFRKHGSNPAFLRIKEGSEQISLQDFIQRTLQSLDFSLDMKKYPFFYMLYDILNQHGIPGHDRHENVALGKIQSWILASFQLNSTKDVQIISDFYLVYQTNEKLLAYQSILLLTAHITSEEIEHQLRIFARYYEGLCNSLDGENGDPLEQASGFLPFETRREIEQFNQRLKNYMKDALTHEIGNFFSNWFSATQSEDLATKKILYAMLMNEEIHTKILLTDSQINAFDIERIIQKKNQNVRDITSYEINRYFLHAIIQPPQLWTALFARTFHAILAFVKNQFDKSLFQSNVLKQSSYPDDLLKQLSYLHQQWLFQQGVLDKKPERIAAVLLLPQHIKTAYEWCSHSMLLSDAARSQYFDALRAIIEPGLLSLLESTNLGLVLYGIPLRYHVYFLKKIIHLLTNSDVMKALIFFKYMNQRLSQTTLDLEEKYADFLNALQESGFNLNQADKHGATAALIAAQNGHMAVIQALRAAGADLDKADNHGTTPALIAAQNGHVAVIHALHAAGADLDKADNRGATPALIAAQNGHVAVIHALHAVGADLNKAAFDGVTPAYIAAQEGYANVIEALGAAGADLNKAAHDGATPAYVAAQEGYAEVIQVLHAAGADLNKPAGSGATPAYIAAQEGYVDVIQALHAAGIDLNQVQENGLTPTYMAAQNGHVEIIQYLLAQNVHQSIPVIIAVEQSIASFVEHEASDETQERFKSFIGKCQAAKIDKEDDNTIAIYPKDIAQILGYNDIVQIITEHELKLLHMKKMRHHLNVQLSGMSFGLFSATSETKESRNTQQCEEKHYSG